MLSSRIKYLLAASALVATSLTAVSFMDDALRLIAETVTHVECADIVFGTQQYTSTGKLASTTEFAQTGTRIVNGVSTTGGAFVHKTAVNYAMRLGNTSIGGDVTFTFDAVYTITKIRVICYKYSTDASTTYSLGLATSDADASTVWKEVSCTTAPTSTENYPSENVIVYEGSDLGSGDLTSISLYTAAANNRVNVCKILFTLQMDGEAPSVPSDPDAWTDGAISSELDASLESERTELGDASTYYTDIDFTSTKLTVRDSLQDLIRPVNVVAGQYDRLDEIYASTDAISSDDQGTVVRDYYAGTNKTFVSGVSPWGGNTTSAVGNGYDREHVICASIFNYNAPMYADVHHLLPVDSYANRRRNDNPFGIVIRGDDATSFSGGDGSVVSYLGQSKLPSYTGTVFEPPEQYKGDIARIYFYFVTSYAGLMSSAYNWIEFAMFDYSAPLKLSQYALSFLLEWAANDPVDEIERKRNEAIYAVQGNRNPYVDFPSLGAAIFG